MIFKLKEKPNVTTYSIFDSFSMEQAARCMVDVDLFLRELQKSWTDLNTELLDKCYTYNTEVNPFVRGMTGRDISSWAGAYISSQYLWNGTRYRSILESYNLFDLSTKLATKNIDELKASITKTKGIKSYDRFVDFIDTPNSYVYGNYLQVNAGETALVASTSLVSGSSFLHLSDTPEYYQSTEAGFLLISNTSKNGFQFEHQSFVHQRKQIRNIGSYTYWGDQIDCVDILVDRSQYTSFPITLDTGFNGADVYIYLVDDPNVSYGTVEIYGQSCTIENEPLPLTDTNRFVHLVYNQAVNQFQIVSYDKGV